MNKQPGTRALVREAADSILAEGKVPSVPLIHKKIGKGSYSTINDELRQWWKDLGERSNQTGGLGLPDSVSRLMSDLWSEAMSQASKAFDEERSTLIARISELETRLESK